MKGPRTLLFSSMKYLKRLMSTLRDLSSQPAVPQS
jgi:hypothetical protein